MPARRHLLASIAFAAALGAAPATNAAAYLYQPAGAAGSYYSDLGVVLNTNYGHGFQASDGSNYHYVICVGSDPDLPGCSIPPGPPPPSDAWYKLPNVPTSAAAQAWSPDYGISRVRSWSSGTHGIDSGDPGYTRYGASANAGWHEEITTDSLTPFVITFVVALHVNWNDGGVFALHMGRPGDYDPDVGGGTPMDGWTWTNCAVCQFSYDTGIGRTVYPGGANGSTDVIVSQSYTVYPAFSDNPFYPTTNPFESLLVAHSSENDAEVLAYSSANLLAILVPPGAGLTFASGHAYNIQVVPEPATYALWALGLVAVGWAKRRRVAER
jgi:hypothetical protein